MELDCFHRCIEYLIENLPPTEYCLPVPPEVQVVSILLFKSLQILQILLITVMCQSMIGILDTYDSIHVQFTATTILTHDKVVVKSGKNEQSTDI